MKKSLIIIVFIEKGLKEKKFRQGCRNNSAYFKTC